MAVGTVLRFGEIWAAVGDLLSERRRALLGYLAAAVIIPWLFFFIFPQSNMRGFAAFFLNNGWYSAETPWTILSMFVIATVLIGAFVFAAWSALLAETRDELSGEVMAGFVNALLSCIVAFILFIVLMGGLSLLLSAVVGDATQLPLPAQIGLQLGIFLLFLFVFARLSLAGPVMAAEGSINPLHGLTRSWALTSGHAGKIMLIIGPVYTLTWLLIGLFLGVAVAVLMATDGTTWHDHALSAVWLTLEAGIILAVILIPAALYRALRPAVDTEVFA